MNTVKKDLIKNSLSIVDELGRCDMDDIIADEVKIEKLIKKAKEIKKNRYWKL